MWQALGLTATSMTDDADADMPTWQSRPWLKDTIRTPAAADPPPSSHRRRPLIYVYDAPPEYNTRMLQYRVLKTACVHRMFGGQNESYFGHTAYGTETGFLEMLLQSPHRTFDGEEADFFYVPAFVACWPFPVYDWADAPWWYAPGGANPSMHAYGQAMRRLCLLTINIYAAQGGLGSEISGSKG